MAEGSNVKEPGRPRVTGLTPMAFVADVQRSVDFYKLLGMEARGQLKTSCGDL
jgi:hypothetical protein